MRNSLLVFFLSILMMQAMPTFALGEGDHVMEGNAPTPDNTLSKEELRREELQRNTLSPEEFRRITEEKPAALNGKIVPYWDGERAQMLLFLHTPSGANYLLTADPEIRRRLNSHSALTQVELSGNLTLDGKVLRVTAIENEGGKYGQYIVAVDQKSDVSKVADALKKMPGTKITLRSDSNLALVVQTDFSKGGLKKALQDAGLDKAILYIKNIQPGSES